MTAGNHLSIGSIRKALEARRLSARELTQEFYSRIDKRNPDLNAYLALSPERAFAQADRVDAMVSRGDTLPPLAGVPMAIKDVISTKRSEEHTSELQSPVHLVCRLLLEKKKKQKKHN